MKKFRIIIFAVLLCVTAVLSSCGGQEALIREIEAYAEKVNAYEVGKIDYSTNSYTSEFWDVDVNLDNNWTIYPEPEMQASADALYDSVITAALDELRASGAGEEIVAAYADAASVNVELIAEYYSEGNYVGFVQMYSMALYSGDDGSTSIVEGVVEGMKEMASDDCKEGTMEIDGYEYQTVEGVIEQSGVTAYTTTLTREKDGIFLVVMIMDLDGGKTADEFISLM